MKIVFIEMNSIHWNTVTSAISSSVPHLPGVVFIFVPEDSRVKVVETLDVEDPKPKLAIERSARR